MPRVLCVWFPLWPIQRLRAAQPELRGRPVVLSVEEGRRGQRVAACSSEAAMGGVSPGMPLAEARTLLEGRGRRRPPSRASPGFAPHFAPADPAADREALLRLCWQSLRYSPHAGLEEDEPPESLLLDVTGCAPLFGGEENLLSEVTEELETQGWEPLPAIADTVGAAWAAARFHRNAPVAIPSGRHRQFLRRLPPAALRLPWRTLATLAELGLETVGQLAALPRASLPSRFGPEVLRRLDQAFGDRPELIRCERPPEPVELSQAFDFPLEDRWEVDVVLRRLLSGILERLHARKLGTQRLAARLRLEDGTEAPLDVGLVSATASARRLEDLLRLQWERTVVTAGVVEISLRAIDPAPLAARIETLFDDGRDRGRLAEWESLLERLSNRLGKEAVVRAERIADHAPERAFRFVPVTEARDRAASESDAVPPDAPQRPLCLLSRPKAIHAVAISPDGPPGRVRWPGFDSAVARWQGPERIETGWWRDRTIGRDYYRIETEEGRRFWIFWDRIGNRWFLHGAFE